jgi:hypothetical protein
MGVKFINPFLYGTAETISKMSQDDFDNPQIKTDYQHHPTRQATSKPDYKK